MEFDKLNTCSSFQVIHARVPFNRRQEMKYESKAVAFLCSKASVFEASAIVTYHCLPEMSSK